MFTWQGAYPARIKAMHLYNAGAMADIIFTIVKFCMTDKLQKRVSLETNEKETPPKDNWKLGHALDTWNKRSLFIKQLTISLFNTVAE